MSDESANHISSFGFERLDVYQRSVEFLAIAWQLGEALPRGNRHSPTSFVELPSLCP